MRNKEKFSENIICWSFSIIVLLVLVVVKCGTHSHTGKVFSSFFSLNLLNIFLRLRKFIKFELLRVNYHGLSLFVIVGFHLRFKKFHRLCLEKLFAWSFIWTSAWRFLRHLLLWLWQFYHFVFRPILELLKKLIPFLLCLIYLIYPLSFLRRYHNSRYSRSILQNFSLLLHR